MGWACHHNCQKKRLIAVAVEVVAAVIAVVVEMCFVSFAF